MRPSAIPLTLALAVAGCTASGVDDGPGDSADEGDPGGSVLEFSGQFRLFNGIQSQEAELGGSFVLGPRRSNGADIQDVEYTLTLKADSLLSGYTLESTDAKDRSFATFDDSGISFFIEQDSPLTAGSEDSVFDDAAGASVRFRLFPVCSATFDRCIPGTTSGFDYRPGASDPFAELPLELTGSFAITRAGGDASQN